MSRRARLIMFTVAAAGLAGLFAWGFGGLPPFGQTPPYGQELIRVAVVVRHIQNTVSGVNFDIRLADTMLEELLLVTAATGVTVLLRRLDDESEQSPEQLAAERPAPPAVSDAVRVWSLGLIGPTVVVGLALVVHGHLTPGGGFQGGALIVTAGLLGFLAGRLRALPWGGGVELTEAAEGTGAGGILVLGFLGMVLGGAFGQNVLPVGQLGELASGGLAALIGGAVGLAVASGSALVVRAFLAEALAIRRARQPDERRQAHGRVG
jgi:multicomponent Na+:H+ antiporter subunit B